MDKNAFLTPKYSKLAKVIQVKDVDAEIIYDLKKQTVKKMGFWQSYEGLNRDKNSDLKFLGEKTLYKESKFWSRYFWNLKMP